MFDHDTITKDESIGSAVISKAELSALQLGVEKSYELPLTGVQHGKLFVCTYPPHAPCVID